MKKLNSASFGISANLLKIIAAITMVIDHVGFMLFPHIKILNIIGRISFPIFAFMICEGCYYTKNKPRYLLLILLLGVATSIVYYVAMGGVYLNVLITFSFSIGLIYLLQNAVNAKETDNKIIYFLSFFLLLIFCYFITKYVVIDYGFWGIILPVLPSLAVVIKKENAPFLFLQVRFYLFAIGVLLLGVFLGNNQMYGLMALAPLALYNGKKGFYLPKYSFYVFYPLHIGVIWLIGQLI